MTSDELSEATATFDSRAEAQAAADQALPRRTKHKRPYPVGSGYHSVRAGHDVWCVIVGNAILLKDGSMYDHQLRRPISGPVVNGEQFPIGYTPEAAAYEQRTRKPR